MARYSQDLYGQDRYGSTYVPFSATVAATVTASGVRIQNSGALSSSATVVASVASLSAAGANAFTSTVTTTCVGERIALGGATSTVASTIACAGQRVLLGNATDSFGIYGVSIIACDSQLVVEASGTMTSTASITAKAGYVRFGEATATSTLSIVSLARLKWSPISEGAEVWTEIAA